VCELALEETRECVSAKAMGKNCVHVNHRGAYSPPSHPFSRSGAVQLKGATRELRGRSPSSRPDPSAIV
jgi:hypothetical protein